MHVGCVRVSAMGVAAEVRVGLSGAARVWLVAPCAHIERAPDWEQEGCRPGQKAIFFIPVPSQLLSIQYFF